MWLRLWGCHGICFTVSVKVSLFLSFTRVYIRNLFAKKLFTHSQTVRFLLIFIASNCEGLGISSLHTAFQAFTLPSRYAMSGEACEGLKVKTFTPFPDENHSKTDFL